MHTKVPLPTDNIYKFYALFGLFILFASMFGFISIYNTNLEAAFEVYEELEILKNIDKPTEPQKVRIEILQRKSEIYPSNKKFFMNIVSVGFVVSISLMLYGFGRWHFKIQPEQDLLMKRQLEKIEAEIKTLNKRIKFSPPR